MQPDHPHLLCAGLGYTARAVAHRLKILGWQISGTARTDEKATILREAGYGAVLWDSDVPTEKAALSRAETDAPAITHLLVSAPPGDQGCPIFNRLRQHLSTEPHSLRWVGYLSTNGVYGNHNGAWVDEQTPPNPSSQRGKRRVGAENDWLSLGITNNVTDVKVFRLPGIYGPGRSALDSIRNGTAKRIIKPGQVFSRMHVDDIAATIIACMGQQTSYNLFNLCDDEPSPPQDVITYACRLLGVEPPPLISLDEADLSPMGLSFYADNKKVRNNLMKSELGIALQYPTYRKGLRAILDDEK